MEAHHRDRESEKMDFARSERAASASADEDTRAAALCRDMYRRFALCNLDELRVIDLQLTRLELGRQRYGHLDLSRPRDWATEESEEHVDAAFYRACAILIERDKIASDESHVEGPWRPGS